ncbi:homoserine dehydrogenase [Liquorilactobacillus satsumensis]|uniref:Homoserine dehydrogenase n=1 Tax=Liquorilactobacillus satsumensis DSM 16230 = JCM 12392 TaxID=1423801 RepID=A0A0R1UYX5_9LACO|nr:homoserine dehydrogenase [Liquorilactobacillus satsumensis]KRL98471.1 homoserine dehydrogenase [Liquorilactobacillus satsumensis DSM 16230 = JCM 12392]MCC7666047.1 homoserine dehydrogenase [Liquorilactobacillus satsumensis]MCP9313051.1 homoserine dehydrogenase [Liquorilactobacillus satsumensis]MCP9329376.1 homoserine dehydrogenase [Liquorilactobacillus satsumensis]MCP9356848.1 homoserine dehydrogenase [Liquorilactobacillus satsumensis]
MQAINIGILGLGTVGSGVLRLLRDHQKKISSITGRQLVVKKVVVHDIEKKRNLDLSGITVTDDVNELINDQDIQIVVEVMGTVKLAKDYIERLLRAGKHIITANKDLIATHGSELAELAGENHCDLFYEASVAGGIPILRTIVSSFAADRIIEVKGIVNGTTNYILTQMNQNNLPFEAALKSAQQLGFAEADPTNDVEGIDAAYKMIILTQFAFGMNVTLDDIKITGIRGIDLKDIKQAAELGYKIKLVGIAKLIDKRISVSVGPVLIPADQPLAAVQNENNAVLVTGAAVGETMFYGPGAGELPTANSVLSDIIAVTKDIVMKTTGSRFNEFSQEGQSAREQDIYYPYYISLKVKDRPGQMLKITKIMSEVNASFHLIIQSELDEENARVVMTTHQISELQLRAILAGIADLEEISVLAAYKILEN